MQQVYIQTYSVRDDLEKDFIGGIKKLAEIGYSGLEFAGGYGGLSTKEMKQLLSDLNLDVISSHVGFDDAEKDIDYIAEIGGRYIICPMARGMATYDDAMKVASELNRIGEACKKAGLKYGYHNHTQEFAVVNGKYLLEHLMENTDPANVAFQLDVGWCCTAGVDAVEFINKHAGRFELIHAKEAGKVTGVQPPMDFSNVKFDDKGRPIFSEEMKAQMLETKKMNVPSGTGIVDWKAVKAAADAQGAKAYIVEREWDYKGDDIFGCVKEDWEYLRTV